MSDYRAAFDQIDRHITRYMESMVTPGMAMALFDWEKCARISTYGFSDLEKHSPVAPTTLFGIGSITKSFTAVAVVQAVEEGRVNLHTPVHAYLPWFQVRTQYAPITLHHLLTHSSGIVGVIDQSPDPRAAVWALRDTETAWPPGSHFYYSDAGYQVLALILEEVFGKPFPAILQTHIFDRLGMAASAPAITHTIRHRMAQGYQSLYDDRPPSTRYPLIPAPWIEVVAGDCCIAATAEDLAKFGQMLLNQGQGLYGSVLSPAGFCLLTQQPMETGREFAYGYGLEIHRRGTFMHLAHSGGMPGYEAFLAVDTDTRLGVVLLQTRPPGSICNLAWTVLSLWRATYLRQRFDTIDLSLPDPTCVENAADYAGIYRCGAQTLTVVAEGKQLVLHHLDQAIILARRGDDQYYVDHPDFDRFLLSFGRTAMSDGSPGAVVEAYYGADWYINHRYHGPKEFATPPEWNAYPGHYRAHIPWQTNFRVLLRKGTLWLVWPAGDEESLTSLDKGVFRLGNEISPERLRFDQIAQGKALHANLSGSDYYRFFTS